MKGLVDGIIATLNPAYANKAWFFKGAQDGRFDFKADKADLGFPRPADSWAPEISGGIDGACDGRGDYAGKSYIFKGNQYWRYDYAMDKIDEGPVDISAWGLMPTVSHDVDFSSGFDAVVNGAGAYANKVYFFKGDRYCRYDWTKDTVEAEASLSLWNLPGAFASGFDAAVTGLAGYSTKAYFFKADEYVRYDWIRDKPDFGPVPVARWWRGLGELLLAIRAGYPALFSQYVFDGRMDDDIADLLNDMHSRPGLWATQSADFARQELENGNLFGIVRAGNVENVRKFVPAGLQGPIDTIRGQGYAISDNALTWPMDDGGWFRGLITGNNGLLDQSLPGGAMRGFMAIVLAHELTHFRNRVLVKAMKQDVTIDAARYTDTAKAHSIANTHLVRGSFIDEIACRHVAWHVNQDLAGGSHGLTMGALFAAARRFAEAAVDPHKDYNDNGYMAALLPDAAGFNRQVGLWLQDVANLLFHNDPATNAATQQFIRDEVAAVQPSYDIPPGTSPNGMA